MSHKWRANCSCTFPLLCSVYVDKSCWLLSFICTLRKKLILCVQYISFFTLQYFCLNIILNTPSLLYYYRYWEFTRTLFSRNSCVYLALGFPATWLCMIFAFGDLSSRAPKGKAWRKGWSSTYIYAQNVKLLSKYRWVVFPSCTEHPAVHSYSLSLHVPLYIFTKSNGNAVI